MKLLPRTNNPLSYLKSYHKPNSFHAHKVDPKTGNSNVTIGYANDAHLQGMQVFHYGERI